MLSEQTFTAEVSGETVTFRTGKLAMQAGGAITIQMGDSVLLATGTMFKFARRGLDFFPLSVEYEEKMYAGWAYSRVVSSAEKDAPHGRTLILRWSIPRCGRLSCGFP